MLMPVFALGHYVDQTLPDRPPFDASVAGSVAPSREMAQSPDGAPLTASAGVASTGVDGPVSGTLLRVADERPLEALARGEDRVEAGPTLAA
jgi:hypothetical protein